MSFLDFLLRRQHGARQQRAESPLSDSADSLPPATDTAGVVLYQYASCPFCVRVRCALKRMGLEVDLRDIRKSPEDRDELLRGGGRSQVPCLRIESEDGRVQWLYESGDIVRYLAQRYGAAQIS